jgi:hypothetical protein
VQRAGVYAIQTDFHRVRHVDASAPYPRTLLASRWIAVLCLPV